MPGDIAGLPGRNGNEGLLTAFLPLTSGVCQLQSGRRPDMGLPFHFRGVIPGLLPVHQLQIRMAACLQKESV